MISRLTFNDCFSRLSISRRTSPDRFIDTIGVQDKSKLNLKNRFKQAIARSARLGANRQFPKVLVKNDNITGRGYI